MGSSRTAVNIRESTAPGSGDLLTGIGDALEEFGSAFAESGVYISKDIGMLWPPVPDEHAEYQVPVALYNQPPPPTPPEAPDRVPETDDAVYAAEAPLRRLLALASVVGLPQQIEREEANMLRGRAVASLVTQGHVATLSVLGERAPAAGEPVFGSDLEEHVPSSGSAK